MGRINRRIYATRRKRSPIKLGLPPGHIPNMINTGVAGPQTYGGWGSRGDVGRTNSMPGHNPWADGGGMGNMGGRGTQGSQLYTQTRQPPYLGGNSGEKGVGGGKTYTNTEV